MDGVITKIAKNLKANYETKSSGISKATKVLLQIQLNQIKILEITGKVADEQASYIIHKFIDDIFLTWYTYQMSPYTRKSSKGDTMFMTYRDFEAIWSGAFDALFAFEPKKLNFDINSAIKFYVQSVDRLSDHKNILQKYYDDDDEGDIEYMEYSDVERSIIKLIVFKSIAINSLKQKSDKKLRDWIIDNLQPIFNKLLTSDISKNKLLTVTEIVTDKNQASTIYGNAWVFVRNLLEIMGNHTEIVPLTFSIWDYIPVWLSFCHMKECDEAFKRVAFEHLLRWFEKVAENDFYQGQTKQFTVWLKRSMQMMVQIQSLNSDYYLRFFQHACDVNEDLFSLFIADIVNSGKFQPEELRYLITLITAKTTKINKCNYVVIQTWLEHLKKIKMYSTVIKLFRLVTLYAFKSIKNAIKEQDAEAINMCIELISFYAVGFRAHSSYFIDWCYNDWKSVLEIILNTMKQDTEIDNRNNDLEEAQTRFVIMVKAAMVVHTGFPDKTEAINKLIGNEFTKIYIR